MTTRISCPQCGASYIGCEDACADRSRKCPACGQVEPAGANPPEEFTLEDSEDSVTAVGGVDLLGSLHRVVDADDIGLPRRTEERREMPGQAPVPSPVTPERKAAETTAPPSAVSSTASADAGVLPWRSLWEELSQNQKAAVVGTAFVCLGVAMVVALLAVRGRVTTAERTPTATTDLPFQPLQATEQAATVSPMPGAIPPQEVLLNNRSAESSANGDPTPVADPAEKPDVAHETLRRNDPPPSRGAPPADLTAQTSNMRTWTSGRYLLEARYVRRDGDKVVLQKVDDTEVAVPLSLLCQADQTYVESHGERDLALALGGPTAMPLPPVPIAPPASSAPRRVPIDSTPQELPEAVTLPHPDVTAPQAIGALGALTHTPCVLKLLGGEEVLQAGAFVLQEATARNWDVLLREPTGGSQSKIARLFLDEDSRLVFQWSPDAQCSLRAPRLRNCVLQVRGAVADARVVRLREAIKTETVRIDLEQPQSTFEWRIAAPPEVAPIKVAFVFSPEAKCSVDLSPVPANKGVTTVRFADAPDLLAVKLTTSLDQTADDVTLKLTAIILADTGLNGRLVKLSRGTKVGELFDARTRLRQLETAAEQGRGDRKRTKILQDAQNELRTLQVRGEKLRQVLQQLGFALPMDIRVYVPIDAAEMDLLRSGP